jgi:hypothetical protein
MLDGGGAGTVISVPKFTVIVEGEVSRAGGLPDLADAIMDVLIDLGVEDPFVFADAGVPSLRAELVVEAPTQAEALSDGVETLNRALDSVRADTEPIIPSPTTRAEALIPA